jgi:hypothetical protein
LVLYWPGSHVQALQVLYFKAAHRPSGDLFPVRNTRGSDLDLGIHHLVHRNLAAHPVAGLCGEAPRQSRVLSGKGARAPIGAPVGLIWTAFHFGSKIAPVHRGRVMWWKFALTLFVSAAFVGAVAATTPHKVRSRQVFVAILSFLCGLATAAVWIV